MTTLNQTGGPDEGVRDEGSASAVALQGKKSDRGMTSVRNK